MGDQPVEDGADAEVVDQAAVDEMDIGALFGVQIAFLLARNRRAR